MLLLIAVLLTYVAITGILDQLFIYPTVIGGALGLTTLETIIVVLLGGLFAGLTGMIFAVPTASVLKYLIPQIYNCWK
jgi:predicted PurR-regulated permease PerM